MTGLKDKFSSILAFLLMGMVRFYQAVYSSISPGTCRYSPSCSSYTIDALKIHGPLRGFWLSLRRIMRCNPWGGWGVDPVPPRSAHVHTEYKLKVQETRNV